jgi:sirohydrochlorin cobaltochelatase
MLILLAHGSRDPAWRESIHGLAEAVARRLDDDAVRVAFMQFEGPTLPEVVRAAVGKGRKRLKLLPLFMASAGHVDKDIRPMVEELAREYPETTLELLTPVGEDEHFPGLILDIITGP